MASIINIKTFSSVLPLCKCVPDHLLAPLPTSTFSRCRPCSPLPRKNIRTGWQTGCCLVLLLLSILKHKSFLEHTLKEHLACARPLWWALGKTGGVRFGPHPLGAFCFKGS